MKEEALYQIANRPLARYGYACMTLVIVHPPCMQRSKMRHIKRHQHAPFAVCEAEWGLIRFTAAIQLWRTESVESIFLSAGAVAA